ncbi:MAG TPA: hypothetical protein VJ725_23945 [Thermoanaerobaculia bacterium]|nr:hypothetical protein [Thermoanaerobaculia bacterium]
MPGVDWRDLFARPIQVHVGHRTGEMKEFHVVFRLRAERSGTLVFFDDDGCIIRRNGEVVHEDRDAHPLQRHEIEVSAGDRLEIAQWQLNGDWQWAGRIEPAPPSLRRDVELFAPYRPLVEEAFRSPNGPPLKTYFAAAQPVCTALAIHSLILNGYRPERVLVFGDSQWDAERRRAVEALLPFAEVVPTEAVLETAQALDPGLPAIARSCWAAMKLCVGLLHPPLDYCFLDDDVFILDRMDEAIRRFEDHDLVYAPDCNHGESYRRIWKFADDVLPTGDINTGIVFVRNRHDRAGQGKALVENPPHAHPAWLWEQGFVATDFAHDRTCSLPTSEYFYPIFDGLPGGLSEYDWAANPCGFVTVHFGGLQRKPSDEDCRALFHDILGRHRTAERQRISWSEPLAEPRFLMNPA